jgi:hypothetical protein
MGRRPREAVALPPIPCSDPECDNIFVPNLPQRAYCYDPECADRRKTRCAKEKSERVSNMRAEGKWATHIRQVVGKGRGKWERQHPTPPSPADPPLVRRCLKCDVHFQVSEFSDDHICQDCHVENDALLAEYTEEALGLSPILPTSTAVEW